MTSSTDIAATDSLGVTIEIGDTVIINAWGSPVRLIDTGKRAKVTAITPRGLLVLDDSAYAEGIANGRSVRPSYVGVARRDGLSGFEGNRARCATCGDPVDAPTGAGNRAACSDAHASASCTCGARDFASCLCGISPRDFHRS